jgi:hypothetical protein
VDHKKIRGSHAETWQLAHELRAASRAAIERAKAVRLVAQMVREESRVILESLRDEVKLRR